MHYWKFLGGFLAFLEVPRGILCIFRRSSWDLVHYLKSFMRSCTFSEDARGYEQHVIVTVVYEPHVIVTVVYEQHVIDTVVYEQHVIGFDWSCLPLEPIPR